MIGPGTMPLQQLLAGVAETGTQTMINGLSTDSRTVKPGDLFFAYRDHHIDRRVFIDDAIKAGAVAVLTELDDSQDQDVGIPIIPVDKLKEQVGVIASRFYHQPSQDMTITGVTGTNGKSSVAFLVHSALIHAQKRSALVGTLGFGIGWDLSAAMLTTPGAVALQGLLADWHDAVDYLTMEVSSHALAQSRVNGVDFNIAILTNLSRDHLDYHKTLASYRLSKSKLFQFPCLQYAVINIDDAFGRSLIDDIAAAVDIFAYTVDRHCYERKKNNMQLVFAELQSIDDSHQVIQIDSPWGSGALRTPLLGRFNIENLLASLTTLCLLGIAFDEAVVLLAQVEQVPGRMEQYKRLGYPLLVVDYAHTPDALQRALETLRDRCQGKLIVVFGCGGNRDKGKRAMMGQVAATVADHIILTNDNPRFEDPQIIITDILSGIQDAKKVDTIIDRSTAILHAFNNATAQDVILIAGKGHEAYQEIDSTLYPFSDRSLAARLIECQT